MLKIGKFEGFFLGKSVSYPVALSVPHTSGDYEE